MAVELQDSGFQSIAVLDVKRDGPLHEVAPRGGPWKAAAVGADVPGVPRGAAPECVFEQVPRPEPIITGFPDRVALKASDRLDALLRAGMRIDREAPLDH